MIKWLHHYIMWKSTPTLNNLRSLDMNSTEKKNLWIFIKSCQYLHVFSRRLPVQFYANLLDFTGAALWSIGLQSSRPVCGRESGGTLTLILFMSTQKAAQGSFLVRPVQTEGWCGLVFEGAGLHWLWGREGGWQVTIKALKRWGWDQGVPRKRRVTEPQPFPSAPQR